MEFPEMNYLSIASLITFLENASPLNVRSYAITLLVKVI